MSYKAPLASATDFGIVKVGTGISVAGGVISTSTSGTTIGNWIPTMSVATSGTVTLIPDTANYAKIGQQVICYFDVTVATKVGGANANALTMRGLPFASIAGAGVVGSLVVSVFFNLNNNWSYISGTVTGASTSVPLYTIHNSADNVRLTYADIQAGLTPTRLIGTITYLSVS